MNHLSEEQLVLLYYGESAEAASIDKHLADCEECRTEFRALKLVLSMAEIPAPVPERDSEYGHAVWQRIEKRLGARKRRSFTQWWIWAPAMAALLVGTFLAGRLTHKLSGPEVANEHTGSGFDRWRWGRIYSGSDRRWCWRS